MADVNHVILIGRLTRDAELKYTAGGQAVCKFSLAVNRRRKSNDQWIEEANFFDVVLWGRSGEAINQYLVKGKQIAVEGELRQDRWEQDGQNRSKVEIMANNVQLLGGGGGNSGAAGGSAGSSGSYSNAPPAQERRSTSAPRGGSSNGGEEGGDEGFADDIPF
jgi:single-strand DNA-binding protein